MEYEQAPLNVSSRTNPYLNTSMIGELIDPKDHRQFIEETLRGLKVIELKEFAVILSEEKEALKLWAENDSEAQKKVLNYFKKNNLLIDVDFIEIQRTGQEKQIEIQVGEPLANDVGVYHILSIVEGIYSKIGKTSNLDGNQINNIMYWDVSFPLISSLMINNEKYGVNKGSRNEILGFITSTCELILNSSRLGWTGNKLLAGNLQENIYNAPSGDNKKKWKWL